MIPVLYKFTFQSTGEQIFLYAVALAVLAYIVRSGWMGARGAYDPKTGTWAEASQQEKVQRAAIYGVIALVLIGVGLNYALPQTPWGQGKGEGVPIHTYGLLIGVGFISAVTVAAYLAQREWPGEEGLRKREQVFDLAFWVFLGGIAGSRLLFAIVNWKDYAARPWTVLSPFSGGLVFYGGLIGAGLVAFFYARKHGIDFLRLGDIAMPTVSLGQCLGRLGCFSAGCCWGDVTREGFKFGAHFPGPSAQNLFGSVGGTPSLAYSSQVTDSRYVIEETGKVIHEALPGAVKISEWVSQHGHTLPVHPTQIYESLGQLILFSTMLFLRRYRRFHGQIFAMWLMAYAVLRTSVELFRGDVERGTLNGLLNSLGLSGLASAVPLEAWYNISTSQFISLCMFTLGAVIIYRKNKERLARPDFDLGAAAPA